MTKEFIRETLRLHIYNGGIGKYNAAKDGLNTAAANKFAKADNLFSEYNMENIREVKE